MNLLYCKVPVSVPPARNRDDFIQLFLMDCSDRGSRMSDQRRVWGTWKVGSEMIQVCDAVGSV